MILTADEVERAAQLLLESSQPGQYWAEADDRKKEGYRIVIVKLAANLDVPHTAEAVAVFMIWMGADTL